MQNFNVNCKYLLLLASVFVNWEVCAVEFELKQKVKSRSSVLVSNNDMDDQGNIIEQEQKKKNRTAYQARLVFKFDPVLGGIKPYAQLGYEWERKKVSQRVTTLSQSYNQSYQEDVNTQFMGIGAKYTFKDVLFADKIKLDFRYDYWLDVDVKRHSLAPDASPLSGSYEGDERKIKIETLYSTPIDSLKLQPWIEYSYFTQNAWQNERQAGDLQVKEKGHEIEARLLFTWLPPSVESLELSIGPEIVAEKASEYEPGEGWISERDDVTLLTFLGVYELEKQNLEFEFWFNHQLTGELDGENNVEFKVDWSF